MRLPPIHRLGVSLRTLCRSRNGHLTTRIGTARPTLSHSHLGGVGLPDVCRNVPIAPAQGRAPAQPEPSCDAGPTAAPGGGRVYVRPTSSCRSDGRAESPAARTCPPRRSRGTRTTALRSYGRPDMPPRRHRPGTGSENSCTQRVAKRELARLVTKSTMVWSAPSPERAASWSSVGAPVANWIGHRPKPTATGRRAGRQGMRRSRRVDISY